MIKAVFYFILVVWSLVSLIVALVKRDENGICVFVILLPMMMITMNNILKSSVFVFGAWNYLNYGVFEP
jgi:hypothetical protein